MKRLKITLFQQKDNGETQILHTQWKEEVDSKMKEELWDKIMSLIREHNMKVDEKEDGLKELRKRK